MKFTITYGQLVGMLDIYFEEKGIKSEIFKTIELDFETVIDLLDQLNKINK